MAGRLFSKGQMVVRAQGQTTCAHHRQTILDWFCKTCSDIICAKCISSTHTGHSFIQLSEETPNNRAKVIAFINEAEKEKLVEIQHEISSTNNDLKRHLDNSDELVTQVRMQGEKLKEQTDILISKSINEIKRLEEENTKLLVTYRTDLETRLEALKEQVKYCKESLQTGSDIRLFDAADGLETPNTLPMKPHLSSSKFCPNINPMYDLEQALGEVGLVTSGKLQSSSTQTGKPRVTESRKVVRAKRGEPRHQGWISKFPGGFLQPDPTNQQVIGTDGSLEELIRGLNTNLASREGISRNAEHDSPQTTVLSTWKPPCDVTSICPSGDGSLWTGDNSQTVTLLSSQGRIEKQVKNPGGVRDICISPATHTLWACSHTDSSITELTGDSLKCRFKTPDTPKCICLTKDGHVLVGMKKKIAKYKVGGELVPTITTTPHGKPLVCTPWRISECPVSEKVAVVDLDRPADGGQDRPHIIVLNKDLHLIHHYGRPQHDLYHGSGSGPFDPCDVTFDMVGRMVVADRANRSIHLLSSPGKYLTRIHSDIGAAWFVSVDNDEIIWAVFSYGGKHVSRMRSSTSKLIWSNKPSHSNAN